MSDIEYRDSSEFGEEELSIKTIVLSHIKKISDISCQEFTGGYWEKKPMKTTGGIYFSEEYHQDMREAYCNAVDFLVDIVYPNSDKIFKDFIDAEEKKQESITEANEKQKNRRQIFKAINKMFDRNNYFKSSEGGIE